MPTIKQRQTREALAARLHRLSPSSPAAWGTLSAHRMLCHLADQLRVALGDISSQQRGKFAARTLVKWLVIYTPFQAPPGRVKTAPEMLSTSPTTWAADVHAVTELLARLAAAEHAAPHPAFGALSPSAWCRLTWKHADHHLRQFGV